MIGASFFFKGQDYTADIPELLLFDMPYLQVTMFDFPENNGVIDAKIDYKGIYPKGTVYGNPLMVTMLTPDGGVY